MNGPRPLVWSATWVPHTRRFDCPSCRHSFMAAMQNSKGAWNEFEPHFCPKCGYSSYRMRFGDGG